MIRSSISLICLLGAIIAFIHTPVAHAEAPFHAGYRVIDIPGGEGKPPITVALWYPTTATPQKIVYGGPTSGNVATDAPLAEGSFPLFVFSHGYGGTGIGAVFFTEALAARGWIVAAPDHHDQDSVMRIRGGASPHFDRLRFLSRGAKIGDTSPADRVQFQYRIDEMRVTLDGILKEPKLSKAIDQRRIAVGGHSLGGFTALSLCGIIDPDRAPRIRALVLFSSGAAGHLYSDAELKKVRIPVMMLYGQREKNNSRGKETMEKIEDRIYGDFGAPKFLFEVKGATHFAFNNRFTDGIMARWLGGTEAQFDVIRRYSIAFVEKYVADIPDKAGTLLHSDPMLTRSVSDAGAAK
jgi:predicted dienelactone hydrolase